MARYFARVLDDRREQLEQLGWVEAARTPFALDGEAVLVEWEGDGQPPWPEPSIRG